MGRITPIVLAVCIPLFGFGCGQHHPDPQLPGGTRLVTAAVLRDVSPALTSLANARQSRNSEREEEEEERERPRHVLAQAQQEEAAGKASSNVPEGAAAIEQTEQGNGPAPQIVA